MWARSGEAKRAESIEKEGDGGLGQGLRVPDLRYTRLHLLWPGAVWLCHGFVLVGGGNAGLACQAIKGDMALRGITAQGEGSSGAVHTRSASSSWQGSSGAGRTPRHGLALSCCRSNVHKRSYHSFEAFSDGAAGPAFMAVPDGAAPALEEAR